MQVQDKACEGFWPPQELEVAGKMPPGGDGPAGPAQDRWPPERQVLWLSAPPWCSVTAATRSPHIQTWPMGGVQATLVTETLGRWEALVTAERKMQHEPVLLGGARVSPQACGCRAPGSRHPIPRSSGSHWSCPFQACRPGWPGTGQGQVCPGAHWWPRSHSVSWWPQGAVRSGLSPEAQQVLSVPNRRPCTRGQRGCNHNAGFRSCPREGLDTFFLKNQTTRYSSVFRTPALRIPRPGSLPFETRHWTPSRRPHTHRKKDGAGAAWGRDCSERPGGGGAAGRALSSQSVPVEAGPPQAAECEAAG